MMIHKIRAHNRIKRIQDLVSSSRRISLQIASYIVARVALGLVWCLFAYPEAMEAYEFDNYAEAKRQ